MHISTSNFQHPLSHQLHTLCKILKVQDMIGWPQMASDWHHVPSISTLPRTHFWGYDQLGNMTCRRISKARKLLSRFLKFWKFLHSKFHFSFLSRISPSNSNFHKDRNICYVAIVNEYFNKNSSRYFFYPRTSTAPRTRRRILLSGTVCPYRTLRVSKSLNLWCVFDRLSNFEKCNLRTGHLMWPGGMTFKVFLRPLWGFRLLNRQDS